MRDLHGAAAPQPAGDLPGAAAPTAAIPTTTAAERPCERGAHAERSDPSHPSRHRDLLRVRSEFAFVVLRRTAQPSQGNGGDQQKNGKIPIMDGIGASGRAKICCCGKRRRDYCGARPSTPPTHSSAACWLPELRLPCSKRACESSSSRSRTRISRSPVSPDRQPHLPVTVSTARKCGACARASELVDRRHSGEIRRPASSAAGAPIRGRRITGDRNRSPTSRAAHQLCQARRAGHRRSSAAGVDELGAAARGSPRRTDGWR